MKVKGYKSREVREARRKRNLQPPEGEERGAKRPKPDMAARAPITHFELDPDPQGGPITHFELDPNRLAVIAECNNDKMNGLELDPDAEWPCNILSRRAVVYGSGRIAKIGEQVSHAVDLNELKLCRRLSSEVASLMAGTQVDMGSASDCEFRAFFIAGNVGEAVPDAMDEAIIWERFSGTIFPPATVTVEPLAEQGVWWSEVEEGAEDGTTTTEDYLVPWRRMIAWFEVHSEFKDTAFVRIGKGAELVWVPEEEWPKGTENTGAVLPRLALGLTHGGSLVGLFGFSVQA